LWHGMSALVCWLVHYRYSVRPELQGRSSYLRNLTQQANQKLSFLFSKRGAAAGNSYPRQNLFFGFFEKTRRILRGYR
jgi:hypothetical protein